MIFQELYKIILSKGFEYVQDPEHRMQIIKVTFVVIMKLFSMVRNRIGKKNVNNSEHIECHCNSCKIWKAKLDDALKSDEKTRSSTSQKRRILSFIPSLFTPLKI
jgi:hypothetical protein